MIDILTCWCQFRSTTSCQVLSYVAYALLIIGIAILPDNRPLIIQLEYKRKETDNVIEADS
jgi:hypothetical protein